MFKAGKPGRPNADERNLKIACLMHAEILKMRSTGVGAYDIRARAADIVLLALKAAKANEGKKLPSRRRLLEVYREYQGRVEDLWPNMQAFLLTDQLT